MSPTPSQQPDDRPDRDRDRDRDRERPGAHPDQELPEGEKPKPGTPTQLPADKPADAKPK